MPGFMPLLGPVCHGGALEVPYWQRADGNHGARGEPKQGADTPVPVPVPVPDLSGDGDGASVPDLSGIGDAPPSPSPIC